MLTVAEDDTHASRSILVTTRPVIKGGENFYLVCIFCRPEQGFEAGESTRLASPELSLYKMRERRVRLGSESVSRVLTSCEVIGERL